MTDNPTWYDILGVPPDASPEDVKAAWRAATDKFEPGSGTSQFRRFHDAADVLLDPPRRAAYDASLVDAAEVERGPGVSLDKSPAEPMPTVAPEPAPSSPPSPPPPPPACRRDGRRR